MAELALKLDDLMKHLDLYGYRDADASPEMMADALTNKPYEVIEFLIDQLEEMIP